MVVGGGEAVSALIRYLVADVVRAQRWIAPLLVFLAALMITTPTSGPVLPTYAISAATLVPVAMWFTIVVFHSEEPPQAAITMAVGGGFHQVWRAKLLTALIGAAVFGLFAYVWITLNTADQTTWTRLGVGALDYTMSAVAGVAFGTLISRPVMPKIAWTVLLGVAICLAQLVIRPAPPVNAMVQLYSGDAPEDSLGAISVIGLETVVLAGLVVAAANLVARTRT
jgi:hypothetical protein